MEKTINIDFDNSTSILGGYDPDILGVGSTKYSPYTHTHGALSLVNLTGTSLSNGLTLSAAPPSAAANAIFAGDYISLSTQGVSTTVSVIGLQSSGPYLTTAAHSTHKHGGAPSITGVIGGTMGSAGWSLSIPDFLLTAAETDHTHSEYLPIGNSTAYASSVLVNTFLTTAARSTHIHGIASGTNITIGSSSNGLALSVRDGLGTNTSLATQTGSVASMVGNTSGLTLSLPNYAVGGNNILLAGNTAGTITLMSSGTVTIAGGNNITVSQNGNAFSIIGAAAGTGGAGTGFSSTSIAGSDIAATLDSLGLSLEVPNYLTTAMVSDAGSNFLGLNTSIEGANMTANSSGITISIPMATATAANAVHAGDYISISTNGANTTVSAINLQATSLMSSYQLVANSSLSLGTGATQSFLYTSNSSLLQAVSNSSLSIAVANSSLFQHTSVNSHSLGTTYTSHTHSNLYIPLSASTAYQTSVLSNTFAVTSHTHTEGNVYFVNSLGSNLTWGSSTSGGSTSIYAIAGGGTGAGGGYPIVISGNTAGTTASISSGTMTLAGGNNITLSQSGNRVSIIGGAHGNVYFGDSNGVSFGSAVSSLSTTITATIATNYAASTHTHSQYLTTAANSTHTHNIGIAGLGNTATIPFTSGSVMLSAVNLTINTSSTGASQYLQIQAPAIGYLFFSNTNGHSWSSSVNGVSTSIYVIT